MSRHILVTGGAGYIGSHTCLALLKAGHRADVRPFLREARGLDIWSPRYFRDLAGKVVYA